MARTPPTGTWPCARKWSIAATRARTIRKGKRLSWRSASPCSRGAEAFFSVERAEVRERACREYDEKRLQGHAIPHRGDRHHVKQREIGDHRVNRQQRAPARPIHPGSQ